MPQILSSQQLIDIAKKFDTPLYVYDANRITEQYERLKTAFQGSDVRFFFASKSLTNVNVLKHIKSLGCNVDCSSINEAKMALLAGFEPQNILYTSNGIHFSEIAKVPAKGNSNTEQVYSFKDDKLSPKYRYVYYELVTTDKNGKESYSAIKMFKTAFASRSLVVQLGPNPIKRPGQLMIQFNAENAGSMTVNVFDANGKHVLKTNMAAFPGLNNGHVHVCDLAPGIYTLQFNYEGLRETKRVVVN